MTQVQAHARALRPLLGRWPQIDSKALMAARTAFVLFIVAYLVLHFDQGWVPHDEGAFAQSAQRVLDGDLPHRDFAELYTGGLTFFNAGVLDVFGPNIMWLRVPLVLLFLLYLYVVYLLSRRLATPTVSALVVLFALSWGLPTYPAAVPSWYLLVFAVLGTYCLVSFHETRKTAWLFGAGVFGGLSICVKVTGFWYIFAAALFLAFLEPCGSAGVDSRIWTSRHRLFALGIPISAFGLSVAIMRRHLGSAELVNLLLPVMAVCAVSIYAALRDASIGQEKPLLPLERALAYLSLGISIPVAILLIPYLVTGSVSDLLVGVFWTPQARLDAGSNEYMSTQSASYVILGLAVLGFVVCAILLRRKVGRIADIWLTILPLLAVVWAGTLVGYQAVWHTARALLPCVVVLGVIAITRTIGSDRGNSSFQPVAYLLLAMTAFLALNQFPFGAPIYFCYVASIVVLAAIAVLRLIGIENSVVPGAILMTLVLIGFTRLDNGDVRTLGWTPAVRPQDVILDPQRASIRVSSSERDVYRSAAALLEEHSRGRFAFAGPDTPELYVLSGLRNPTRSLFDALDPTDSARGQRLVATLLAHGVTAIAINLEPTFSRPLDEPTLTKLRSLFPRSAQVSQFEIRWRLSRTR